MRKGRFEVLNLTALQTCQRLKDRKKAPESLPRPKNT